VGVLRNLSRAVGVYADLGALGILKVMGLCIKSNLKVLQA